MLTILVPLNAPFINVMSHHVCLNQAKPILDSLHVCAHKLALSFLYARTLELKCPIKWLAWLRKHYTI